MKKKLLSVVVSLAMALSLMPIAPVSVEAAGAGSGEAAGRFYKQLAGTPMAQKIYELLEQKFTDGDLKDGAASIDLITGGAVTEAQAMDYVNGGSRALFVAFAAAKDAFDLEHPEAWYIDSSKLSLRVATDAGGGVHASIGPGRTANYYVSDSLSAVTVQEGNQKLSNAISQAVSTANNKSGFEAIREVHNAITTSISYRFETDCQSGNIDYIRTAYGLVTHEGVCEAYVRSFQMAMNQLDIPCVPIHGVQTTGEPESHMWCAVQLGGSWYVVDPTWDDPVPLDANGKIKTSGKNGNDGYETEKYLMVGLDVVGRDWKPVGIVSDGGFEFSYPEIATFSYGSGLYEDNGLKVEFDRENVEGVDGTTYTVSYKDMGLVKAAKEGYYMLVKMYDVNTDGSVDAFDDWYYVVHGLHTLGRGEKDFNPDDNFTDQTNKAFYDTPKGVVYKVTNCEYVEFAVTTKAPPDWQKAEDLALLGGYYSGDYSDIVAESGLIYNPFGNYEQPPAIKSMTPGMNTPVTAGREYHIKLEFTDELYRPQPQDVQESTVVDGLVSSVSEPPLTEDQDNGADVKSSKDFAPGDIIGSAGYDGVEVPDSGYMDESEASPDEIAPVDLTQGDEVDRPVSSVSEPPLTEDQDNGADVKPSEDSAPEDTTMDSAGYDGVEVPYSGYMDESEASPNEIAPVDLTQGDIDNVVGDKSNDYETAVGEDIKVWYDGITYSWGMLGRNEHKFANKPDIQNLKYLCSTEGHTSHSAVGNIGAVCRIYGLEYDFKSSKQWADDSVYYRFHLDGLIGVKSNKKAVEWGWVFENTYPYTTCPLVSPFKKNMWGQPSAMANPDGINFEKLSVEGVGVEDGTSLAEFMKQAHIDPYNMNARLMLVVDTIDGATPKADEINQAVAGKENISPSAVQSSSIFEIDFARVCAKTIVNNGESVRVCVGFPEGYDASMEGIVFKAYHFVLDANGSIKGVEPITCTVTQYGLVIECKSFSPFMVAAVNAAEAGIEIPEDDTAYLLVSSEGYGSVLVDGKPNNMVEFTRGSEHTFTIKPQEGYSFDTIAYTGCGEIELDDSLTFTLKYDDIQSGSALLSVAFAAKSVKEVEEKDGLKAVPPPLEEGVEIAGSSTGNNGGNAGNSGNSGNTGSTGSSGNTGSSGLGWIDRFDTSDDDNTGAGNSNNTKQPASGGNNTPQEVTLPTQYVDVPKNAWYYSVMADMYARGLMVGLSDTEMAPMATSSRAQIAMVLYRAAGSPRVTASVSYADVDPDAWYYDAVAWASDAGVAQGYGELFGSSDVITREQMITMLYRFWAYLNGGAVPLINYPATFDDMEQVSSWAKIPVGWAQSYGIAEGSNGNILPKNDLNRAEMAAFISRFLTWYKN